MMGRVAANATTAVIAASEITVIRRRIGPPVALENATALRPATMAKDHGNSMKNDRKYEALRDKGYSKEPSAKIANSGKNSSRAGGKHSH